MGKNMIATVARYLLGIGLLVFGLNGFLHFIPMGQPAGDMGVLMGLLAGSGFLYVVKALEVLIGIALLANKYVPLSLVLLAPLSVNFILVHIFWAPESLVMALVFAVLNVYLLYANANAYKGMLKA